MPETVSNFLTYIINTVKSLTIFDIIDILIVSVIIYYAIRFIKDKRAAKLFAGLLLLTIFLFVSSFLNMIALNFILTNLYQVGVIALLIVFQPELRSALEKVGGTLQPINKIIEQKSVVGLGYLDVIAEVAEDLSLSKTGALIVIERTTKLGDISRNGVEIGALISSQLLKNIFFNKAPLHDGALIIRDGMIFAAGCYLPLSSNNEALKYMGTRHRAGLGISENSDAVVIIVSEESGIISTAVDGVIVRGYTRNSLYSKLVQLLQDASVVKKTGRIRRKLKDNSGKG